MENNILLPKTYLSSTAMDLWIKDKDEYMEVYFKGKKRFITKYTEFGKYVHDLIENDKHHDILPDIVRYEFPEHNIRTNVNGVPVLAKIDTYSLEQQTFRDYKTAMKTWTKLAVQKSRQLLFYATVFKWHTGVTPEYCHLDWIETKEIPEHVDEHGLITNSKLIVTGKVVPFERKFDIREIERMENEILKIAIEISEAYKKFIEEL